MDKPAKPDVDQPRPKRSSYTLCPEAAHFVEEEMKKRKRLGMPHWKRTDVVNDWIIDQGKHHGHKEFVGDE